MMTGFFVLKIDCNPSIDRRVSRANSGPLWSMTGVSIARNTRSGTEVGREFVESDAQGDGMRSESWF